MNDFLLFFVVEGVGMRGVGVMVVIIIQHFLAPTHARSVKVTPQRPHFFTHSRFQMHIKVTPFSQ